MWRRPKKMTERRKKKRIFAEMCETCKQVFIGRQYETLLMSFNFRCHINSAATMCTSSEQIILCCHVTHHHEMMYLPRAKFIEFRQQFSMTPIKYELIFSNQFHDSPFWLEMFLFVNVNVTTATTTTKKKPHETNKEEKRKPQEIHCPKPLKL